MLTSLEICAGAGGQALGLEQAGFSHVCLVENDPHCCRTLRANRPQWRIEEADLRAFSGREFRGTIDLLAGGVPCPPFSVAGKQFGENDERNLFPEAVRLMDEIRPRAVMIENVRGLLDASFLDFRDKLDRRAESLGYKTGWKLLNASDHGVSQLRPRVVFVAIESGAWEHFRWPDPAKSAPPAVGDALYDLMNSRGWRGVDEWRLAARAIAPTLVGGSKKHGGPDLGPTRAKKAWAALGVDGHGVADQPPDEIFTGMPKLTVPMTARLQGFPDAWTFTGKKTAAYRQVGNAFPPPVARAVGLKIFACLSMKRTYQVAI
jgi:DNA (cytosine-5)-methyltransferase 1